MSLVTLKGYKTKSEQRIINTYLLILYMVLDKLDIDILFELEKDSSIQTNILAKKLKKSKDVISYRINRLKKENILRSCSAIVDMTRLGHIIFRVYIKWQNMDDQIKRKFYDFLGKKESVWTTTILHGKWDFAIFIGLKNETYIEQFHTLWQEILGDYKEKIAEHKIAIYSPIHNFNKRFFSDGNKDVISRIYGNDCSIEYDDLDLKIIHIYSPDVRQSLVEIANKTGASIETVRRRIKELEKKKIIVGYKIDLDLPKLGYQGYRVDFALNSMSNINEILEYIKNHQYFYQINKSIGGADLETEIVVRDLSHLLSILEEMMSRFKDVIKNYEYMGYTEFPKLSIISD